VYKFYEETLSKWPLGRPRRLNMEIKKGLKDTYVSKGDK
jgi:hypothetical protein